MQVQPTDPSLSPAEARLALRTALVSVVESKPVEVLAFGVEEIDAGLVHGGIDRAGLHEIAARSGELCDDAAATLFIAGIAARLAALPGSNILWALTRFDLYAPGLEQAGLGPDVVLYAQGRNDLDVLAFAEDGLREGSLACVVAEIRSADMTATRRLQLAAAAGSTPILLYRRHRSRERCPLGIPSAAMTRWRIGSLPSVCLPCPGVGRARWQVELVRQRGGNPFSLECEACDDKGRLALSAAFADRTIMASRRDSEAA